LAAEGASLVLCARTAGDLRQVAAAIGEAYGVPVLAEPADLTNAADIARLLERAHAQFGRVDVLVTNGGGPPAGPFESLTPAMWDAATKLTLGSVVQLVGGVLPGMKARGWGRIINVTSIAVKQPVDSLMLSNSLRAAVTGFARTLANEVARFGVTVNNALPGYTRTDRLDDLARASELNSGVAAGTVRRGWEAQIPAGRLGEPREFAALVAFLASERAAYITGTSITVDGGWVRSLL
jgi:3-oxoacyl-[acyl-carrier protein] reductase